MHKVLAMSFALGLARIAVAGTPFGGDESGFVPPDEIAYKCGRHVTTALAKLERSITSCNRKTANAGLRGTPTDDEPCEGAAKAKFDATITKLLATTACFPCLAAATAGLADAVEAELDAGNGAFYCAGFQPFGGDNTGYQPISSLYYKCSSTAARNVSKFGSCITACHNRMALYALNGRPFDVDACENACLAKYNQIRDSILPLCPPCLQLAEHDQLAADAETTLDQELGNYHCASPSGAFIDPTP
jgi:hypothetical protein